MHQMESRLDEALHPSSSSLSALSCLSPQQRQQQRRQRGDGNDNDEGENASDDWSEAASVILEQQLQSCSSVWSGPPHALSVTWLCQYGSEYVAIVLWIGKDWSWSQLRWTNTAFFFGTLAAAWLFGTTVYTHWRLGLYSETYKNVILCLWLVALYAWMMGDLWTLWFADEGMTVDDARVYQALGLTIAQWVLFAAVVLYTIFFVVLVPLDVFATADRNSPWVQQLEQRNPSPPSCFAEFRIYAALHFYTWVLKDCMWAWELPLLYFAAFIVTVLLNLDLLRRFARHTTSNMYIEFWNYVVIFLWVLANGSWAFGELVANAAATEDQFRKYTWPHWKVIRGTTFHFRYTAGWIFLVATLLLGLFYAHWILRTLQKRLPPFQESDAAPNDVISASTTTAGNEPNMEMEPSSENITIV